MKALYYRCGLMLSAILVLAVANQEWQIRQVPDTVLSRYVRGCTAVDDATKCHYKCVRQDCGAQSYKCKTNPTCTPGAEFTPEVVAPMWCRRTLSDVGKFSRLDGSVASIFSTPRPKVRLDFFTIFCRYWYPKLRFSR